jgi:iron(III) transport system substrate-binding protein
LKGSVLIYETYQDVYGSCSGNGLAALLMTGCGGGGGDKKAHLPANANTKVKGDVMVYTSIYPDILDKLCKPNVAKVLPNLKVTWFQGGTEKVKTKIAGEIKANKSRRRCADGC